MPDSTHKNPSTFELIQNNAYESIESTSKFLEDTWNFPDRRLIQVGALADGVLIGGIKAIPDQVINHPKETATTAMGGAAIGAICGAAIALESPILLTAVALGTTVLTGAYVYDLGQKLANDKTLNEAFDKVWKTKKLNADTVVPIEKTLGKETFDLGLASLSGGAAFKGGAAAAKVFLSTSARLLPAEATASISSGKLIFGESSKTVEFESGNTKKQDTCLAMERSREGEFYERYQRANSEILKKNIDSTPLAERLSDLRDKIKIGDLRSAYDLINANLGWLKDRDCSYGSLQDKLAHSFLAVGTTLWSAIHENAPDFAHRALKLTEDMQSKYGNETDWPLQISATMVKDSEITNTWSDKKRVDAIEKLLERGYYGDARDIAISAYHKHLNNNPTLGDKYDALFYEIYKFDKRHSEASYANLIQKLTELKNAVFK